MAGDYIYSNKTTDELYLLWGDLLIEIEDIIDMDIFDMGIMEQRNTLFEAYVTLLNAYWVLNDKEKMLECRTALYEMEKDSGTPSLYVAPVVTKDGNVTYDEYGNIIENGEETSVYDGSRVQERRGRNIVQKFEYDEGGRIIRSEIIYKSRVTKEWTYTYSGNTVTERRVDKRGISDDQIHVFEFDDYGRLIGEDW